MTNTDTVDTAQKASDAANDRVTCPWHKAMVSTAHLEALRYENPDKLSHVILNATQPGKYTWLGDYWDRTITGCTSAVKRAVEDEAIRLRIRLVDRLERSKLETKIAKRRASQLDAENEKLKRELAKEQRRNHRSLMEYYDIRHENSLAKAGLKAEIAELKAQLASGTDTEDEAIANWEAAKKRVEECQESYDQFLERRS